MQSLSLVHRRLVALSALARDLRSRKDCQTQKKSYRPRQVIFYPEDKNEFVYQLVSGQVKLSRSSPTGREITFRIVTAGDFFGESDILETKAFYGAIAEVIEDSTVYIYHRVDLANLVMDCPTAIKELMILQSRRRKRAEARLAELIFLNVTTRIALLLARLSHTFGRSTKGGTTIGLKLTHQEVANIVGTTRETATVVLNDFRRKGMIHFAGHKIIVVDSQALMQLDVNTQFDAGIARSTSISTR